MRGTMRAEPGNEEDDAKAVLTSATAAGSGLECKIVRDDSDAGSDARAVER